jgi:hypothetical protein
VGVSEHAASVAPVVVAQSLATATLPTLGLVIDFVQDQWHQRLARWWQRVVADPSWENPQAVQANLKDRLKTDPKAKDVIWQSAKYLAEAVSLDSCEPIGSITAEYLQENVEVDVFFRGAIRLLADLSTQELGNLRDLVSVIGQYPQEGLSCQYEWGHLKFHAAGELLGTASPFNSCPMRLFRVIKENDFGDQPGPGGFVVKSGHETLIPESHSFSRLAKHLGVPYG